MVIQEITPVMMDRYYQSLLKVKSVTSKYIHPRNEYLSPSVIREIHKIIRSAFNMAVKWELITRNPVDNIMGNEYTDYNMVFAGVNGRPVEGSQINRLMADLIRKNNLPHVVFHSIRHTSVTYKLKLNGGDVKSVQGDSGHSQSSMVTDVYSHILDEGRRNNARLFEDAFYSGRNEGANVIETQLTEEQKTVTDQMKDVSTKSDTFNGADAENADGKESDMETFMRLLKNPEIAGILKTLSQAF